MWKIKPANKVQIYVYSNLLGEDLNSFLIALNKKTKIKISKTVSFFAVKEFFTDQSILSTKEIRFNKSVGHRNEHHIRASIQKRDT